jgi:hypothetical protein
MDQITPGMTYGLTALSLAVYAIPLVIVAYLFINRIIKAPRERLSGPGPPGVFARSDFVAARRQRTHRP